MAWAPDYVTASEVKSYHRITDSDDDTEIGFAITGASRAIDRAAHRQFGVVDTVEVRRYEPQYDRRRGLYVVEIDDLMTKTGLIVTDPNGDTVSELAAVGDGGYILEPVNAAAKSKPWTQFVIQSTSADYYDVTGLWGWSAVPDTVKLAALIQTARFVFRRDAPEGVAGSPELGSETRLLAKLDPDVDVLIGAGYRRVWGAAA